CRVIECDAIGQKALVVCQPLRTNRAIRCHEILTEQSRCQCVIRRQKGSVAAGEFQRGRRGDRQSDIVDRVDAGMLAVSCTARNEQAIAGSCPRALLEANSLDRAEVDIVNIEDVKTLVYPQRGFSSSECIVRSK